MLQNVKNAPKLKRLVGDRAFYARVIGIVVPLIIQNTVTNVVSLLDNVMVGRVGTLQMSAVAIVNQLLFVFNLCIFGGLAGAGIFATQFAGAEDHEGVRHCLRMKWIIAMVMLVVAHIVFALIPEKLISMYLAEHTLPQDAANTLTYGMDYLGVMLWGLVPFAITQIYASTLREVGETRLPMIASVVAILVNLVFNYLLIFGTFGFPRLGVVGAAIATVLSRYVETVIIVVYTHAMHARFPFIKGAYRSLHIPRALLRDIVWRGSPLLVNEFLWSSAMAVLLQCYSVRGLDVVAAANISSTVSNLFNVVFLSMGNAVAIMVGQALGANKPHQAKDTAYKLIALSVAICVVMGLFMIAVSPMIPQLYNTEEHVRHIATQMLRVVAVMMPVYAFAHCCFFTLRSGGRTMVTFLFDCVFTWVVSVPVAYLLGHHSQMDIVPLYFCVQALDIIKCVIGYILVSRGVWIHNIVAPVALEEEDLS